MNRLPISRRARVIRSVAEGTSVQGTARLAGVAKATVLKLVLEVGEFCSCYQDSVIRNLKTRRVKVSETWTFVGAKQDNATTVKGRHVWTFTAMDAESKLMISWLVGPRSRESAQAFTADLSGRLSRLACLSTEDIGLRQSPNMNVERDKLDIGVRMHSISRLTSVLSDKAENHALTVSLLFMLYNFCRPNSTVTKASQNFEQTPAMASGLTDHVWSVEEILAKMDPTTPLQSS